MAGAAEGAHVLAISPDELTRLENNGQDVQDIVALGLSSDDFSGAVVYQIHTAMPVGSYHVRMNGTVWNGSSDLGTKTTTRSNTFTFNGSDLPGLCGNIPWTPVRSVTDPTYNPLRIITPIGGSSIANGLVSTFEMVNTQTGFSAGVQKIAPLDFDGEPVLPYDTSHLTLDPGSWMFRANFTSPSAHNPGSFVAYSDEFFITLANQTQAPCVANSTSSPSGPGSTSAPAGTASTSAPAGAASTPSSPSSGSIPTDSGPGFNTSGSTPDSGNSAGVEFAIPMLLSLLVPGVAVTLMC
ncbi:hypothetical protein B0H13DRAFT_1884931 [Mycena leptocephala]|nr:hypothetical protein B0H13DRAFT_1884931 [Mycena leptocephala]